MTTTNGNGNGNSQEDPEYRAVDEPDSGDALNEPDHDDDDDGDERGA